MSDMKIFWQSVRYDLRRLIKPTLIFLATFIVIQALLILFSQDILNGLIQFFMMINLLPQEGLYGLKLTPIFLPGFLLLIIIAFKSFRPDFNHLMTLGSTRGTQFSAGLISAAITVIPMSIICLGVNIAETTLAYNLMNRLNPFRFVVKNYICFPSGFSEFQKDFVFVLLFYLGVYFLALSMGRLMGILVYRFGHLAFLPVWIVVGVVMILYPVFGIFLPTANHNFFEISSEINPLYYFLSAIVIQVLSFFALRKLPLKA